MSSASNVYSVEIVRSTSFTAQLRQGFNMLHVPVNDPRLERLSDLYAVLGGSEDVEFLLTYSSASSGRIDIGQLLATAIPTASALLPNYPNPFNPETWIPFDLSEAGRVSVTIYNAAGQTVRVLELGQLPAGSYRSRSRFAYWDGRTALGEPASSGVYFVRIEAGSFSAMRRMVVLK